MILEDIDIVGIPLKTQQVSKWQQCILKFYECIGITYWRYSDYCSCFQNIDNFTKRASTTSFLIDDELEFGCSPDLETIRKKYMKKGIQFLLILKEKNADFRPSRNGIHYNINIILFNKYFSENRRIQFL